MKCYFSLGVYRLFFVIFFLSKLFVFFYMVFFSINSLVGGGNDADYYNDYALGYTDYAVNIWPLILRFFNEIDLYERKAWSFLIFLMSSVLLPYFFYKIVKDKGSKINFVGRSSLFIIMFYPTIFFFTFDIYRDVVMYTVFVFSLIFARGYFEEKIIVSWFYLFMFLVLSYFLFLFRPYMGASLVLSLLVCFFYSRFSKNVKAMFFIYIVFLLLVKISGVLNPVLEYRGEDGFASGGATLGIGLLNQNPVSFLFLYVYSFFAQVFGFFIVGFSSFFVFITESMPFIFSFYYVFKNIRFITKFGKYLIVFFVIYTTIWVMGNDNLGTAVRLRVPSYLSIFACMLIIYQQKIKHFYFQAQWGRYF